MRFRKLLAPGALAILLISCKSVPVAPVVVAPVPVVPPIPMDRKAAWMLRLEQQRILRDAVDPADAAAPNADASAPRVIAPARVADLTVLILDTDAGVRRRAALAIGRIGRADGVAPLAAALTDTEEDVRASAAFALGLIGLADGVGPLTAALKDPSPL